MNIKIPATISALVLVSSTLFAEKPSAAVVDKMESEATQADSDRPALEAATREMTSRALSAIPLFRVSSGVRILPFIDQEGQPVAIGKPLLAFQILPFPDSRGNLIPILRDGPSILPFIDQSGEPIPIGRSRHIEPLVQ